MIATLTIVTLTPLLFGIALILIAGIVGLLLKL